MNKTLLLALLGFAAICRPSFAADNFSKTNAANQPTVEVKCQLLTVPMKVLKETGNDWIANESFPPGACALVGIYQKDQLDVLWKAFSGQEGVIIKEVGDITVKSGESGKAQKGYDFSYPVDYDAAGNPTKMGTRFLGTTLEVQPFVSDVTIDLSGHLKVTQLKEITQVYPIKESDLVKKPSLAELVSAHPMGSVFNPVFDVRGVDTTVTLYTGQSIFYSMDDYENSDLLGKIPPQQMKLKDPSKRCFLIITATVIEPLATKH
jgi:hypothetical protein